VIIVDTLRADHLSAYGYNRETSPQISDLGKRGVLFQNAIAPSSWTIPSHASLLTARLPREHRAERGGAHLDERFPTLAEAFRARGYRTAAFSANWWNFARRLGFGRGFMRFEDFDSVTSALVQTNMGERLQNVLLKLKVLRSSIGHSRSGTINRDMFNWIDRSQGPFFVVANYMDVHEPYLPAVDCLQRFSSLAQGSGSTFFGLSRPEYLNPARVQDEIDAYDASIYCMDQQLGLLQQELTQRGLMRNTVLVLTSDHGEGFDEHRLMSHGNSLYRELIHVPLIMVGPGIPAGIRVPRPVSLTWLPATLLTLSGGNAGPSFPGVAMQQAWNDRPREDWPHPVSQLRSMHLDPAAPNYASDLESILTPEWHLIVKDKSAVELYRYDSDPRETVDLASRKNEVAHVLKDQLQKGKTGHLPAADVAADRAATPERALSPHTPGPKRSQTEQERDWQKANDYLKALGYIPQ
jgi:arylsulfatase A-like enzyme